MSVIKEPMSPLEFQEEYLNEKPIESIREVIHSLEHEILYFESLGGWQAIQRDNYILNAFNANPRDLNLFRDLAVNALKAAGGKYRPINNDKRIASFNSRISDINDIIVTRSSFFYQYSVYWSHKYRVYHILENQIKLEESDLPTQSEKIPDELPKKRRLPLTPTEFFERLKGMEIGGWYSYYDMPIMEGVKWKVEFHYKSKYRTLIRDGYILYPKSFKDFCDLLELNEFFAELLKK